MFLRLVFLALASFVILPLPARSAPRYQLVVVDSPGQRADEIALETWKMTRHPRSRCGFRWIRIGSPASQIPPKEPDDGAPEASPREESATPSPLEPEWDPSGSLSSPWRLEGLPRILLISQDNRVLLREVFLPRSSLRYLSRHPEGFSQPSSTSRMGNVPPEAKTAGAAEP